MYNVIISMYGVVIMFFDQNSMYIFCDCTRPRGGGCTSQTNVPEVAFENLATKDVTTAIYAGLVESC